MTKGFRSDEEREFVREAIRENQEAVTVPGGVDFNQALKAMADADKKYWTERELAYGFIRVILDKAHENDGWLEWFKLERSIKGLEAQINHSQGCPKCKRVVEHAVGAIDYINMVPRAVTLEDGEKALRSLAKKNCMSVEDFRAWIDATSDKVIKEMNEGDKTD